jgi:serine/threonine-protein kinase
VKLMDFGIARTAEGAEHPALDGQTVGTPYYMSPEQAMGRELDARSDLYTVGVVLFELFTGQRPFPGTDAASVMQKHVTAEPPRPSALRPDLPDYLEKVVLACLSKRPDRRPLSAADLYGALTRVAA